jgi:parallel beta-helix repeat protein
MRRAARWLIPITGAFRSVVPVIVSLLLPPVWAAERHVDPRHSAAADVGEGSRDAPFRTLAFAMSRLSPGDALRIAAGTYRESIIFPKKNWSATMPTTISGDGSGVVKVLGTDVIGGWEEAGRGIFVKRPWTKEPQQVFIDGRPLGQFGGSIFKGYPDRAGHDLGNLHRSQGGIWPKRQPGNQASLPPESFYFDSGANELIIRTAGSAMRDGAVEVSFRPYLVQGDGVAGVTLRDLRFRYSSTTTTSRQGAITLIGDHNAIENVEVEDADGVGIELSGDDNRIVNCRVTRSGYLGIKARGHRVEILGNDVSYNNTRGFNKWWEAGGMKFVGEGGLRNSRVSNNRVHHNFGDGIWFDWGNDSNRISNNIAAYNDGFGIHYEASSKAYILDNQVFGNRQRGIYLPHSRDSIVAHNLIVANGLEGVAIVDEKRRDSKGILDLRPTNNAVLANILAWNRGTALILPGVAYENRSDANLFLEDKSAPEFSMGWPKGLFGKHSFTRWQRDEHQDSDSSVIAQAMDSNTRQSLSKGVLEIDWSSLYKLRSTLAVAADRFNNALGVTNEISSIPGPR